MILSLSSLSLFAKVYDCCIYFNEWEVLEIRLNELYPHVDKFVIVEASESFRGIAKPFNFERVKERFKAFADKIIYVKVDEHFHTSNPFEREGFQRNQMMRGLKGCQRDDLILISDVDEIPDAKLIAPLQREIKHQHSIGIRQKMYRHFLNRRTKSSGLGEAPGMWVGTFAVRYDYLCQTTPNKLRYAISFSKKKYVPIWEGGWHFTSLGGFERFKEKCSNWSHWKNPFPNQYDAWRSEVEENEKVEIDSSFPRFVLDNIKYLTNLGLIDA